LAVGVAVAVTGGDVSPGVGLGVARGVEPHAAMNTTAQVRAIRGRTTPPRLADGGCRLLSGARNGLYQVFASPAVDGVDHALQVDP
jgi:hypothetical protein